ncbi:MAG: DUF5666 domain-containing protein [Candidatus Azambacteria bacterium]|nr:DUF5666 domain-containing protein [Candidatus Azambacteria bacterium]
MNKKIIMTVVITLIIAGGAGFYSGMLYGQSTNVNSRAGLNRQGAGFAMGAGQRGGSAQQNGGFSGGEIIKKDDSSITVKLNSGSSQIILFSDTTKVMKSVQGLAGDLIVGEQVTVTGSKNQDGSLTAQSIQIRPQF